MQIVQATISDSRKIRCIDRLGAKGQAVYEDDIRDIYADTDGSTVKNTLDNGINVQCPTTMSTVFDAEDNYIDKVVCDAMDFSKLRIACE